MSQTNKIAIFILILGLIGFMVFSPGKDYNKVYSEAEYAYSQGKHQVALDKLNEVVKDSDNKDLIDTANRRIKEMKAEIQKAKEEEHKKQVELAKKEAEVVNEMKESYNIVMSRTKGSIYAGCNVVSLKRVIGGVNGNWYALNEGQKEVWAAQSIQLFCGMLGARGIKPDYDNLDFEFVEQTTMKKVASRGPILGLRIEK